MQGDGLQAAFERRNARDFLTKVLDAPPAPPSPDAELIRELVCLAYIVACFAGIGLLLWVA